jgi:type IV pilus assembly protein PilV
MIAMMITLVVLLGLLQSVNVATVQNLGNSMRNESMQIAENEMSTFRAQPFNNISASPSPHSYKPKTVPSRMRGTSVNYTVVRTVTLLSTNSKMIQVGARWKFKNNSTTQWLQTVVSQVPQ